MATHFPNLARTEGAKVVEMLSGEGWEGLEGVILNWEASSGTMLMILGGLCMVEVVVVVGSRVEVE